MPHACIQFQPTRAPDAESALLAALRELLPNARITTGNEDGLYINIHFEARSPTEALATLRPLLDSPNLGPPLRASSIIVCQGPHGWDDYLLLHHYDPTERVDSVEQSPDN